MAKPAFSYDELEEIAAKHELTIAVNSEGNTTDYHIIGRKIVIGLKVGWIPDVAIDRDAMHRYCVIVGDPFQHPVKEHIVVKGRSMFDGHGWIKTRDIEEVMQAALHVPPAQPVILSRLEMSALKAELYASQNKLCHWCGKIMQRSEVTLEHLIPLDRGGDDTKENIVLACRECNMDKGNMTEAEYKRKLAKQC